MKRTERVLTFLLVVAVVGAVGCSSKHGSKRSVAVAKSSTDTATPVFVWPDAHQHFDRGPVVVGVVAKATFVPEGLGSCPDLGRTLVQFRSVRFLERTGQTRPFPGDTIYFAGNETGMAMYGAPDTVVLGYTQWDECGVVQNHPNFVIRKTVWDEPL